MYYRKLKNDGLCDDARLFKFRDSSTQAITINKVQQLHHRFARLAYFTKFVIELKDTLIIFILAKIFLTNHS